MENLLNEHEAAEFLGVKVTGLRDWRINGNGPPYCKMSARVVRYRPEDLRQWIEQRMRTKTKGERK